MAMKKCANCGQNVQEGKSHSCNGREVDYDDSIWDVIVDFIEDVASTIGDAFDDD